MDKHYCKNVDALCTCSDLYISKEWQFSAVQHKYYFLQYLCIGIYYTAGCYCSYGSSVLPQPACPEAGARRGLQLILGLASGCTVRAWIDHCAGWSRSPSQTAPGGTNVERARMGRLGAVTGAGAGLQPGQEPPGRDEKSVWFCNSLLSWIANDQSGDEFVWRIFLNKLLHIQYCQHSFYNYIYHLFIDDIYMYMYMYICIYMYIYIIFLYGVQFEGYITSAKKFH